MAKQNELEINKLLLLAAEQLTEMVGSLIQDAGPDGIPAGILYAGVMSHMSPHTFDAILDALKHHKDPRIVVERDGVLYWTGPQPHPFVSGKRNRLKCAECGWVHGSIVHSVK